MNWHNRFQKYFAVAQHSNITRPPPFLRQADLYGQYSPHIQQLLLHSPTTTPVATVASFIQALATTFPEARINYIREMLPNGSSQMTPVILGIVRNKEPMIVKKRKRKATSSTEGTPLLSKKSEEEEQSNGDVIMEDADTVEAWKNEPITCCWEENAKLCNHVSNNLEAFKVHLSESHKNTEVSEEDEEDGRLKCHWRSCSRFHNVQEEISDEEWMVHVLTHVEKKAFGNPDTLNQLRSMPNWGGQSLPDMNGVPLTAGLILKNIARFDARLLLPYESELAAVALSSHGSARYAADILQECTKQHAIQVAADLTNENKVG